MRNTLFHFPLQCLFAFAYGILNIVNKRIWAVL